MDNATTQTDQGRIFSIVGFVLAVPALILFPPVFGLLGVVFGIIGHSKGDPLGKWAAVTAAVCGVVGAVLGVMLVDMA